MPDAQALRTHIRTVPDWPRPGVMFRDITPLLRHPQAFAQVVGQLADRYRGRVDLVAGIDARGFILGAPVAYAMGLGFVPIRKQGKLPYTALRESYDLEYGTSAVELHADACEAGQRVVLIDDLIATGGTMMAGRRLIERLGGTVVEAAALVDLPELGGSARLRASGLALHTLIDFEGH